MNEKKRGLSGSFGRTLRHVGMNITTRAKMAALADIRSAKNYPREYGDINTG
jgi:hypothetical protein